MTTPDRCRGRGSASASPWLHATAWNRTSVWLHVLEVLPRIGLIRDGHIRVAVPPLEMVDGKLRLGAPRVERLDLGPAATYGDELADGDLVALHWQWVCGRLTSLQATRLRAVTERNIAVANTTT